jgi:tetratricopeptide (TPR) repeat protein
MPESACLHIQDRESGPIRVVELPWISVRIGRAAYCEVRLSGEDLPNESCRLTRRGRTWSLVPSGGPNHVILEGRTVKSPCPLPFDVPFLVGGYGLILKHDVAAEPVWEIVPSRAPDPLAGPFPTFPAELADDDRHIRASDPSRGMREGEAPSEPILDRGRTGGSAGPWPSRFATDATGPEAVQPAGAIPAPGPEAVTNASRPDRDRSRWEARWKAAEAHLKARASGFRSAGEGPAGPSPSPFEAVPVQERPTAAPRTPVASTPLIDPTSWRIPAPKAPRIEPAWSPPRPQEPSVGPSTATRPQQPLSTVDAPRPSLADGIALERSTDPIAEPPLDEPSVPEESLHDTDLPEPSSATTELDMAVGATPRDEAPAGDSGSPLYDAGFAFEDVDEVLRALPSITPALVGPAGSPAEAGFDAGHTIPEEAAPRDVEAGVDDHNETPPDAAVKDVSEEATQESSSVLVGDRLESPPAPAGSVQPEERIGDKSSGGLAEPDRRERGRDRREAGPSADRLEDANRPSPREPKARRNERARLGSERRGEGARAIRANDVRWGSGSSPREAATHPDDVVWPSVKDILANHRGSPGPRPAVLRARQRAQALPTIPREPAQWQLPVWLVWPPLAVSLLIAGLVVCGLSRCWMLDASSAAVVTQRLMTPDPSGRRRPLPPSVVPPQGRWVTTTAQHLTHWAIYLRGHGGDPDRPMPEAASLLTRALEIAPLNPTARLALAQGETPGSPGPESYRTRGLSRDSVSLARSARRLLAEGKKDAALRLYEQALTVAASSGISRSATPRFLDELSAQRYLLPGEDALRDIITEMSSRAEWTFGDWSKALPRHPAVLLATARLLRESRNPDAERFLDLILEMERSRPDGGPADPGMLAARAEALALRSRLKDAEQEYRQAIELVDNDVIRRSWWFNLAEIARRLNDEGQRQTALRAAMAVATSDDISRRVISIRRAADSRAPVAIPSARAN